ncbi:hypothetical protein [Ethanoligenens sp.]|uniref:hypothetical protein n=1 Tax=Ethanoligenens sp. TaxID=2099655 RepID=UPI0039EA06FB
MNPFNPGCIARGLMTENDLPNRMEKDTECHTPRILVATIPGTGLEVYAFGNETILSVFLERIAATLVEKDMSPFALMLSAQQGKDENLFKQEVKWVIGHGSTVAISAEIEYHGSTPGVSVRVAGDPDGWSHLMMVLIHDLLKDGFSFEAIVECLQTGARSATKK